MLRLNDYLPYLINRLGPSIEEGFAGALADAGVSLQMWRVMAVLYEYGDQSVGDLSRLTSIPISTLSRLIDRMVKKNLVSRRRGDEDARSVSVHILENGRLKTEGLIPSAVAYDTYLTRNLSEAELTTFKALLVKFYDGMTDAGDVSAAGDDRLAG